MLQKRWSAVPRRARKPAHHAATPGNKWCQGFVWRKLWQNQSINSKWKMHIWNTCGAVKVMDTSGGTDVLLIWFPASFLKQQHHAVTCKRERRRGPTSPVCALRQKHDNQQTHAAKDLPSAALMSHCLYYCLFIFVSGDHFQTSQRETSLIIPPWRKRLRVHSHTWIDRGIHLPPKRAPRSTCTSALIFSISN